MSPRAEVSVVTPTRNRLPLLQQAVDSVLRQTFDAWELVVVDDASDDGTWEWLRSFSDPRIRSLRLEERGEQSRTRNTGVKASTAPIVVSLDDDDLLTPNALERHVEALREHPRAIASVGGYEVFDERGARTRHRLVRRKQVRSIYRDLLFGWMPTAGESAFRREILERVDYWDESWRRATDHELWSRVGNLGDVVVLPDIVLHYRVHSGQWRPPDLDEVMTRARERAVAQTEGESRRFGEETLAVRRVFQEAYGHFIAARAWSALGLYLEVAWRMPSLLTSPLTRPMILHPMSRCLVGPWGIRLGRILLPRVQRYLGRDVDFSVRTQTPDSQPSNCTSDSGDAP